MSLAPVDLLHLTYRSLRGNPLRSSLTMLGIFMGVAAVSATLQVGAISRAVISERLSERDAPQISIAPRWLPVVGRRVRFQVDDLVFLQQRLTQWDAISALRWLGGAQMVFQDQEANPSSMAVTLDFFELAGKDLLTGRFFSAADFATFRPVVVIDEFLAEQLFEDQDPIGGRVYADQQPYTVVGVVAGNFTDGGETPTGEFFVPMAYYHAMRGRQDIGSLKIRPDRLENLEQVAHDAEQLLMQRFPGEEFWVWNNIEDILEQQQVLNLASRGLAAVGAISLLVGGVGIANIMIASVTERTAEIGLRRAIGATQLEIMTQFILEASLLSLLSGTMAIATVHGLTILVADQYQLPYEFEWQTASLALGSALGVGVGASFMPALRASRLDPVTALRAE